MSAESIARRNAANAQFSTGPRTPEGKAISSGNAEVHGFCSVEPPTPADRAEADALYSMLAAELKPITPMEIEAVRDAAKADQKRRRIGRALEDVGRASTEKRQVERKEKLAGDREQAVADVAFWTLILGHPPTPGQGLKPAVLESVLGRFGVDAKPRKEDVRADLVQFLQVCSKGDALYQQALDAQTALAPGQALAEDLRQSIERARQNCENLVSLFHRCLDLATQGLAEASERVARNEANPKRDDDWFDDSKRTQLLHRYYGEAERAYYRALRSFDTIRRRQDAERRQKEREERQARKALQDAEKAARQAARQAEIDAKAKPQRDEMTAKVVEPFVAKASQRNEPRSAVARTEPTTLNPVATTASEPVPASEGPRVVRRRGKAVVVEARKSPRRR